MGLARPATRSRDKICWDRAPHARQGCGSLPEPSAFIIASVNQCSGTAGTPRRSPETPTPPAGSERRQGGKCAPSRQARGEDPHIQPQACGCLSSTKGRVSAGEGGAVSFQTSLCTCGSVQTTPACAPPPPEGRDPAAESPGEARGPLKKGQHLQKSPHPHRV